MISDYVPVLGLNRQASTTDSQMETFSINYRLPGPATHSLSAYTQRMYRKHIESEKLFDDNGFINDWWNSMPQELKDEVFAIRKQPLDGGSLFIAPANFKEDFLENANFFNVQLLGAK